MATNVLKELREYEKIQEEKLEQLKNKTADDVEKARKGIEKSLAAEGAKLESKKHEEIEKSKEKAKEKAKETLIEYRKKTEKLEKRSSENFNRAVDLIFSAIFD